MDELDVMFDDFDLNLDDDNKTDEPSEDTPHVAVRKREGHRQITRKAASEASLETQLDWHFKNGDCYHCFSFGDVDSLTYLKHVLKQQKINYLALSTWCMAGEDVRDLITWHRRGMIDRVDFFVGEIFKSSYAPVYDAIKLFIGECGGRLVVFRNHAKVMMIKGERFDCLIESSANINTNPRAENTVITVDSALVNDYIKLFGEIRPFNKDFGAEAFKL